ncbi:MAG TPA: tyrosine--tRNA ligase [Polyangia bacterium]|nr:tyrosine--tRNA ligase [Polyangia bacterium]
MSTPEPEALRVLRERGFVQQISDEAELARQLTDGRVTYYAGFDPTADSLHLGHFLPLMAMAHLARAGHRPIAVLGGGTAMVGDPSGKTELRQMLSGEVIAANRVAIEKQVRAVLEDASDAVVVDNGEWLLPLNYVEFLRDIGKHFSVNRMLAAEAYKLRLEKGLSFIEFNYMLLQAYDFLTLRRRYGCTLQIGGDDQWGNIIAGIELIRRADQGQAYGLTFPLIMTAAGTKMGKTAAGAVWLDAKRTSPYDFYQYFVNVDDRDVVRFLKLFTFLPLEEITRFERVEGAELREAKALLARAMTELVHGAAAADEAKRAAAAAFGGGGDDAAIPTFAVRGDEKIVDVLAACGLAASKSAARRLVEQGGVRLGDRKIAGVDDALTAAEVTSGVLLHAGKKHVRRLVIAS